MNAQNPGSGCRGKVDARHSGARVERANPESRDSGSGPSDHPGMTKSWIARRYRFARTAMTRLPTALPRSHRAAYSVSPLPLWERSYRIEDAIRVRGHALSRDLNPSPQP